MTASFTAAFPNGVSSGDVTQTSAVVWTRAVETGRLTFQIATDSAFHHMVKTSKVTVTDSSVPVKIAFDHLKAGQEYFYRAIDASGDVIEGRFETAAKLGTYEGFHFGVVGDWRSELAPYVAIKNAASADLNLLIKLGDTVYADQPPPPATTLAEFRAEHIDVYSSHLGANYFADLQATTSVLSVIDDHEVTDDFAGGAPPSSNPTFVGQPGDFINETPLYANGVRAFNEFNAIENRTYHGTGSDLFDGAPDLYRYNTYGSEAAIIMVDARSFRDTEVPAPANPLNPAQVGQFLAASFDPTRTMLGDLQLDRLEQDLLDARDNGLTWKFVMLPEPIQNFGPIAGPGDHYEGYAAERNALLKFIDQNHIDNVVFVSTDLHWLSVNNLTYQDTLGGPQIATSVFEVDVPAVASNLIGPLVAPTAAALGLISPAQLAFYNTLPNAPDSDNILNDKDDFAEFILDQVISGLGYDPIGLDNNLAIAAGKINATLLHGDYFVGHDFGWTDFNIEATTGKLLVTTYGVPGYTDADVSGNPAAVLALNPTIVSQFEVTPTSGSIIGTARNDDLHGTNNADVILGAAGNDDLQGRDGNDYLDGGKGNDDIGGGAGNDRIFGRDGNDKLDGQDGNDLIDGGRGNDQLKGGAGSDTLIGGLDDDELNGGAGDDHFVFQVGDSNGPKHDIVEKFNAGPLEHDVIELHGWAAYGVTDFASLQSHMFNKSGDVWIVGQGTAQKPAANTDIIVLDHTKLADLQIGDFLLV
jgi:phosphodiesterase/alkaline phosphatase D-like protein